MEKFNMKEILRNLANFKYEKTDDGRILMPSMGISIGGIFGNEHKRSPLISKAIESGDPERLSWAQRLLKAFPQLALEKDIIGPMAYSHNIVVNEGLDNILDVYFHNSTQTATWYIAPFEGDYTPVATLTAATFDSAADESTAYNESTRVEYVEAAASSQSITNSASPATFTWNASKTIYGAGLLSVSTKESAAGVLAAASRFSASRAVVSSDVINVTYQIDIADA